MIAVRSGIAAACVALVCGVGAAEVPGGFGDYWYTGEAEITSYRLEQSRYGQTREGDAVLIFVTEDFLPGAQVKYEGRGAGDDRVSVLKLNLTRNFLTGIYPYSMMSSIFTPVSGDATLKTSTSVQEWCGHTYTQLNRRDGGYRGTLHSYFQDEADREFSLDSALLEDEIWTRIRLRPDALPTGDIQVIPGLQYARLAHRPSRVEAATGRFETLDGGKVRVYTVEYRDLPRKLSIAFESAFPHAIVRWTEHDARGGASRVTQAERVNSMRLDYWNRNGLQDARLRKNLGLE